MENSEVKQTPFGIIKDYNKIPIITADNEGNRKLIYIPIEKYNKKYSNTKK